MKHLTIIFTLLISCNLCAQIEIKKPVGLMTMPTFGGPCKFLIDGKYVQKPAFVDEGIEFISWLNENQNYTMYPQIESIQKADTIESEGYVWVRKTNLLGFSLEGRHGYYVQGVEMAMDLICGCYIKKGRRYIKPNFIDRS